MDELGFNKLFAGVLLAGLLLMAGVKFADVLVPHTELAENAYVIEVPEITDVAGAAPVETGPAPILALLADADPLSSHLSYSSHFRFSAGVHTKLRSNASGRSHQRVCKLGVESALATHGGLN
ncbi:MAG: hypothetical protein ACPHO7_00635 [Candidatus Puniceispirillaceae bacterium]